MAICDWCNQEMQTGLSCMVKTYLIAGEVFTRIPSDDTQCHDCGIPDGALHHPGCDVERCPKCHGQAIGCGCDDDDDDDMS
jgi:hypothetical protein